MAGRSKPAPNPLPNNEDVVMMRVRLRQVECDPIQFKPQSPKWEFEFPVYVEIPVPSSMVKVVYVEPEDEENGFQSYIVTTDGYAFISNYLKRIVIDAEITQPIKRS